MVWKYFYHHLVSREMGTRRYTGEIIELKDEETYNSTCEMEQEIVDRGVHSEWHKPFKQNQKDFSREYFKANKDGKTN